MVDIRWNRQGNVIIAFLLLHFVFFGYICYANGRGIGENLLFLNLILFSPNSFLALPILFVIIFIFVLREDFYEYGIRTSLWFVLILLLESWIWYWFDSGFDLSAIVRFFTRVDGYLTILTLFVAVFVPAIIASYLKEIQSINRQKIIDGSKRGKNELN